MKFPQAQEQSNGKSKILAFEQGMQQVLKQVMMETNYEYEAVTLAKAVKIVCKEIIGYKSFHFDGKFPVGCLQESVPSSLKTLVSILLNGADLKDQDTCITDSQASLTISQMILFNFHLCASSTAKSWHSLDRNHPCHCMLA